MTPVIDPHERVIRMTALFMLLAGAGAAGMAGLLHSRQVMPHAIDLVVSSTLAISLFGLFVCLWLWPSTCTRVIWAAFVVSLLAVAVPAWFYPIQALSEPGGSLVGTLPPISAVLLPIVLALMMFFRARVALVAGSVSWLLVATPILVYLFSHPDELHSPRGMDVLMTLGPVMLLVLAFIPFHRGIERWVAVLQGERAKLQALAERDGLTGLYNRRASEGLLSNLLATPDTNDALILFDIDRFKSINDTHGHPAGDEVLRQVARRCEALLRRDDVFARWGGEEFLVLVRGARDDGSTRVAEAMRLAISATPITEVGTVTASFGVARFRPFDTMDSWMQRADTALYEAKHAGRDRVVSA